MGQKVHPTGIRLGIVKDWNSRWFASSQDYSKFLFQDIKVREFLKKKLAHASVSKIQINNCLFFNNKFLKFYRRKLNTQV